LWTTARHADHKTTTALFYVLLATDVEISAAKQGDSESGIYHCQATVLACCKQVSLLGCTPTTFGCGSAGLSLPLHGLAPQALSTRSLAQLLAQPLAQPLAQLLGQTMAQPPISASSRHGLSRHTQSALNNTGQHRLATSLSDLPQLAEHAEGEQHTAYYSHALLTSHAKLRSGVLQKLSLPENQLQIEIVSHRLQKTLIDQAYAHPACCARFAI